MNEVNNAGTKKKTSRKKSSRNKFDREGMLKSDLNVKTNELFDRQVEIVIYSIILLRKETGIPGVLFVKKVSTSN